MYSKLDLLIPNLPDESLKPGLRLDFDRFIAALHVVNDKNEHRERTHSSNNDFLSLLKTFMKSFQINIDSDSGDDFSFLSAFIENILSNLLKNKNNYRYDKAVLNFAQSLYILGGRNLYEFVRMNLPRALLSLTTLSDSSKKAGGCTEEAEFRFDDLHEHKRSMDYQVAVCSEDCTGVIKKIKYNASTNTFSGFSVPLQHGLPVARYFQTNSFRQLKEWFETEDKSSHLNIHMIQPLFASNPYSSSFLLAAYSL